MNKPQSSSKATGARALIDALVTSDIRYLFGNFGSDHAGVIQAMGEARLAEQPTPTVILCPHESVATSAAHGYAQATGLPQAVFVHCDVGTANLGGTLHNAARCRVPLFVFAGATPFTLYGELPGTRNREANYSQDVFDQASIVRPYVKWAYELRTARNVHQVVRRALTLAKTASPGPVYLTAAREVLEEDAGQQPHLPPVALEPTGLTTTQINTILSELALAKNPLIVTSYSGRQQETVGELVRFAEALKIPVLEVRATDMNFPGDHPLRLGGEHASCVEQADVIFAIDCELPWLPLKSDRVSAKTLLLDQDPLKEQLPLWEIHASQWFRADSLTALQQLNLQIVGQPPERHTAWITNEKSSKDSTAVTNSISDVLTATDVFEQLQGYMTDETILVDEAVTNSATLRKMIPRNLPGTFYSNGGTSLGWSLGASIGIKLANPEKPVVTVIGDGAFLLGTPAAAYWTAAAAETPFLTLILNNRGWNATKQNMLRLYPNSDAGESIDYLSRLNVDADLSGVASSISGAFGAIVRTHEELAQALLDAIEAIHSGKCAVLDIRLEAI